METKESLTVEIDDSVDEKTLNSLKILEEKINQFQQQKNYIGALEYTERAIILYRNNGGNLHHKKIKQFCYQAGELCNLLSMTYLQEENYDMALELLKKAEIFNHSRPEAKAVTLNNLGCYYRRIGKIHSALTCLSKALEIEQNLIENSNIADTHLNICAILSQLGKHQKALEHAQSAIIRLQEKIFSDINNIENQNDRITVLCIAYHNVGAEYEFLKNYEESVMSYKKGISIAEKYLETSSTIGTTLRNSYLAAKRLFVEEMKRKNHFPSKFSPIKKSKNHINKKVDTKRNGGSSNIIKIQKNNILPPLISHYEILDMEIKANKEKETIKKDDNILPIVNDKIESGIRKPEQIVENVFLDDIKTFPNEYNETYTISDINEVLQPDESGISIEMENDQTVLKEFQDGKIQEELTKFSDNVNLIKPLKNIYINEENKESIQVSCGNSHSEIITSQDTHLVDIVIGTEKCNEDDIFLKDDKENLSISCLNQNELENDKNRNFPTEHEEVFLKELYTNTVIEERPPTNFEVINAEETSKNTNMDQLHDDQEKESNGNHYLQAVEAKDDKTERYNYKKINNFENETALLKETSIQFVTDLLQGIIKLPSDSSKF